MTFFHNLNKTLDSIAARPEAAKLNERDMSRAAKGYEKYGKEGMQALAKAGREGKALDPIRKKYDKYDNEQVDENLLAQIRDSGNIVTGQKQQDRKNFDPNTGAPLKANSVTSGIRARMQAGMQNKVQEGPIDAIKSVGKKVAGGINRLVGHGSDADMIRDLQKRMGIPQTGMKPTEEPKEGNEFSGELQKARATGQKEFEVDGKEYPVKETEMTAKQKSFAALAEPKDKITFADKIAGAKKEVDEMLGDVAAEAMRNALSPKQKKIDMNKNGKLDANDFAMLRKGGKNAEMDEAMPPRGKMTPSGKMTPKKFKAVFNGPLDWPRIVKFKDRLMDQGMEPEEAEQAAAERLGFEYEEVLDYLDLMNSTNEENDFTAHQRPAAVQPKVGSVERGSKHDIKHTATGRIVTRRVDPQGMSVGSETDAEGNTPEKRGRGRPKGAPKGPERTTANAYKHKGERKVKEGEVSTGNLQKMHQLVTGLKSYIQDEDGQAALKELTALIKHYASKDNNQELDEKATSKKQQKFMGMVHAAQKGEKPASKEVGKVAKSMGKKDVEDFASTKHKGLPEKKKSQAKESESMDSDADSKEDTPKKSKSKFKFGGSVYETLDAQLETLITEGMSVTVNMSQGDEHGEDRKNITVNADGEDADRLAELLKMAGISQQSSGCSSCGSSPCGCDMIDENNPNWPSDTETSDNAMQYSGGLNGPKSTGQATTPVLASQLRRQVSMEQSAKVEQNLLNLYRTFGK